MLLLLISLYNYINLANLLTISHICLGVHYAMRRKRSLVTLVVTVALFQIINSIFKVDPIDTNAFSWEKREPLDNSEYMALNSSRLLELTSASDESILVYVDESLRHQLVPLLIRKVNIDRNVVSALPSCKISLRQGSMQSLPGDRQASLTKTRHCTSLKSHTFRI